MDGSIEDVHGKARGCVEPELVFAMADCRAAASMYWFALEDYRTLHIGVNNPAHLGLI
jgi:hypothetical protein